MSLESRQKKVAHVTEPENPVEDTKAKKVWDEREGSIIVRNKNYRKLLIMMCAIIIALTAGLVYKSVSVSVVPYVVEIDKSTGEVNNVGPIQNIEYTPKENEIKFFLRMFVNNVRSMPLDPVVYKKNWDEAYNFMTANAQTKMSSVMQDEQTAKHFGQMTVITHIKSILPIGESGVSYQVQWTEERFAINNGEKTSVNMTGVFSVANITPKNVEEIEKNPLGIFISDFSWQEVSQQAGSTTSANNANTNSSAVNRTSAK